MNNLQKDFLNRSRANLENLTESAKREANLSPEFLRGAFRALHTIKGTSQTFGFNASARLAHELENFLTRAKTGSADFKNDLLEGFALLINSFEKAENSQSQEDFTDKISRVNSTSSPPENFSLIPPAISKQLSEFEKKAFVSAHDAGKKIFCVKAIFDLADFSAGFKKLRENLSFRGEIIATLPTQTAEKNKIGFLIYFASGENEEEIIQKFSAEIVSFSDDLNDVLAQIAAHGKDLAEKFEKKVEIIVSADKIKLSAERQNLVFDILLHMARNAVDHAIEKPVERIEKGKTASGTIEISLKTNRNNLQIEVKDDGKGVDLEKIKAKAIEKNLISDEKILTENELLDLIFLHEFSTSESVSEISGRGVGLDAVKNLIENAGGEISVKSLKDAGTTFEIFIPKKI